jgi:hypothetical protein
MRHAPFIAIIAFVLGSVSANADSAALEAEVRERAAAVESKLIRLHHGIVLPT